MPHELGDEWHSVTPPTKSHAASMHRAYLSWKSEDTVEFTMKETDNVDGAEDEGDRTDLDGGAFPELLLADVCVLARFVVLESLRRLPDRRACGFDGQLGGFIGLVFAGATCSCVRTPKMQRCVQQGYREQWALAPRTNGVVTNTTAHEFTQATKQRVGGAGARHMTDDETLNALAFIDWKTTMALLCTEFNAHEKVKAAKVVCEAAGKARLDEQKQLEKEAVDTAHALERQEKRMGVEAEKARLKYIADVERARAKAAADEEKTRLKEIVDAQKAEKKRLADKKK
ncbi:hypothetical protein B0H17DRAFT_1138592 [Mycena rosella]|uniref:Uncharacterized protein n=1 Tax=Mycena rosella TaxID=1033263 RepID=A0AAD7D6R2_MYCRO|nr:hypothetical protein B0H17DRAFT_1138592 [Mycena rosella]